MGDWETCDTATMTTKAFPRCKPPSDFDALIRRGAVGMVRKALDSGRYCLVDEREKRFVPFELALKHGQWSTALLIFSYRRRDKALVAMDDFYAFRDFLSALAHQRDRSPLPKAQRAALYAMAEAAYETTKDPNTFLAHLIDASPTWLDFPARWLKRKAPINPNAVVNGYPLLGLAAIRGNLLALEALLQAGADPLAREADKEQNRSAVHLAVDLGFHAHGLNLYFGSYERHDHGAYHLGLLEGRLACFERLMALPGVAEQLDHLQRTPTQCKEQALKVFLEGRPPRKDSDDENLSRAYAAAYRQRLHELLWPPGMATRPSLRL